MLTPASFTQWLLRAKPKEVMTYHRGFLLVDRERSRTLSRLADRVWAASDGGFVMLTQRRLGEDLYAYQATRTGELYV